MCDCPTTGVITTHETHKSWIIFKDNKTHIGKKEGYFLIVCSIQCSVRKSESILLYSFGASGTMFFYFEKLIFENI